MKLKLYPRGLWEGIVSAAPVQANYLIRILYRLTKLFARPPEMTRPLPAKLKGGMGHANSASGSFVRYVVFFRHRRMVILDWTLLSLAAQYTQELSVTNKNATHAMSTRIWTVNSCCFSQKANCAWDCLCHRSYLIFLIKPPPLFVNL